jgi:3-oxoadipate enol-lactonase
MNSTSDSVMVPVERKELKQGEWSLHYYLAGPRDKELIVFLHPAFADYRCFEKQMAFFSRQYRVITVDMPGHGKSQTGKSGVKIGATSTFIRSIIEKEGYQKAHLVGVSMGTLIAQQFAFENPQMVSSLSALGGYSIHIDNKAVVKAQRGENIKWIFKALFSMNAFRRYVARVSVLKAEEQQKIFEMTQSFTRKSFMVMSDLGKLMKPGIPVVRSYPLMVLCGDNDNELALTVSRQWHQAEPASRFVIISNAGHCANMDNAEEFNNTLNDFLNPPKY